MPFDLPKELLAAGGWAFAAVIVTAVLWAVIQGWLVPKAIHQREMDRAEKATGQLERMGESQEELAKDLRLLIGILTGAVKINPPGGQG